MSTPLEKAAESVAATQTVNVPSAPLSFGSSNNYNDREHNGQLTLTQLKRTMSQVVRENVVAKPVKAFKQYPDSEPQPAVKIRNADSTKVCMVILSRKLKEQGVDIFTAIKDESTYAIHVDDTRNPQRIGYLTTKAFADAEESDEEL